MGLLRVVGDEVKRIFVPSCLTGLLCAFLLEFVNSIKYLQNYPINVKMDQLRMLPLTMGMDVHYLLRKTGYYWEHLLIFLAFVYATTVVADLCFEGRKLGRRFVPLTTMGYQMLVCGFMPPIVLVIMRNLYFAGEQWNKSWPWLAPLMRQLVPYVWHVVGIVSKMRLAMHALAFFKRIERDILSLVVVYLYLWAFQALVLISYILYRGTFENEVLLLLITPIVSSMILPFLTFASRLLAPLNIDKLELDQWLYSDEKKGFNEQLVVVLFEWYDVTAINGYFDLNWLCFFGFLASILWLCSSKETNRSNDGTFNSVFHKNMIKLLCLTAPFLVKAVLPKYHYLLWWDNHVDRSGYTFWCTQIYLHLFALIARVRLLQHIFTSLRPQN